MQTDDNTTLVYPGCTPSFSQIKTESIHEQVVQQISQMVASGQLKRGEKLPSERELKEMFGVSRASLREGLRILKMLGIIDIRPGSGIFVTSESNQDIAQPLSMLFMPTCPQDVFDLLDFRRYIECECIRIATPLITGEDISLLYSYVTGAEDIYSDSAIKADWDFHFLIASKSDKKLFVESMKAIILAVKETFRMMRKLEQFGEIARKSYQEHIKIIKALEKHDSELAAKAMYDHLTSVKTDLSEILT